MKYVSMILLPLLLLSCQDNPQTYSGNFDGFRQNADRLYKAEITLYGYLGKSNELYDDVSLHETREKFEARVSWQLNSNEIFVDVNDFDVRTCHDKYVKLTGELLAHDYARVFVKALKLEQLPDPSVEGSHAVKAQAVSCFK